MALQPHLGFVNFAGRKVGHFFGYGTIGLMFRRAWYHSLRSYVLAFRGTAILVSSVLGIVSTFALASLDEWHQMFLPGRASSFHDVMVDTAGALFLTIVVAGNPRAAAPQKRECRANHSRLQRGPAQSTWLGDRNALIVGVL